MLDDGGSSEALHVAILVVDRLRFLLDAVGHCLDDVIDVALSIGSDTNKTRRKTCLAICSPPFALL